METHLAKFSERVITSVKNFVLGWEIRPGSLIASCGRIAAQKEFAQTASHCHDCA
eukprot:SAG31_NODE_5353_length_2592_cov_2.383129_4_plen_55_part_00